MRIIPAIDIIDGYCVRLSQGNYNTKKIYHKDPLDMAKQFEDAGIQYLHLVDLDGAKSNKIIHHKVLSRIAHATNLKIDFGGGLKSDADLKIAFENGANQVTGGSIAVKSPEIFQSWVRNFGSEKIILGADAKNGKVATNGWTKESELSLLPFIEKYLKMGIRYVISTDINKDGMLTGPATDLYTEIIALDPEIKLIASGGICSLENLEELSELGCEGAIIGKAIYEGHISLRQLEKFISEN